MPLTLEFKRAIKVGWLTSEVLNIMSVRIQVGSLSSSQRTISVDLHGPLHAMSSIQNKFSPLGEWAGHLLSHSLTEKVGGYKLKGFW